MIVQFKKCYICKKNLSREAFYKSNHRKDGLQSYCKVCDNKRSLELRRKNGYNHSTKIRERNRNAGYGKYKRRKSALLKYYRNNKIKIQARNAVREAIKKGFLGKKHCKICKKKNAQAHHHKGYERDFWLKIIWLCREHHRQAHYEK